jgi:hypothetical protein
MKSKKRQMIEEGWVGEDGQMIRFKKGVYWCTTADDLFNITTTSVEAFSLDSQVYLLLEMKPRVIFDDHYDGTAMQYHSAHLDKSPSYICKVYFNNKILLVLSRAYEIALLEDEDV